MKRAFLLLLLLAGYMQPASASFAMEATPERMQLAATYGRLGIEHILLGFDHLLFVFALIFRHFAIPARYQHKVLFYGVLGAMVFRAIFVAAGVAVMRFEWVLILFGVFLIATGIRMAFEREARIDPGKSVLLRWAGRLFPVTSDSSGGRFFQQGVHGGIHRGRIQQRLVSLHIHENIALNVRRYFGNAFGAGAMVGAGHASFASESLDSLNDAFVVSGNDDL